MKNKKGWFQKGHIFYKGAEKGWFKKGQHASPKTEFKKGQNTGEKHQNWKGGKYNQGSGYIRVWSPNHPNKDSKGYVYEHRLLMEQMLGRYLKPGEIVHHINGIKDDNREKNLQLMLSNKEHFKNTRRGVKRPDLAKYKQIFKNPLPVPQKKGELVSVVRSGRQKTYITKKCPGCKKLFWTRKSNDSIYCCSNCWRNIV